MNDNLHIENLIKKNVHNVDEISQLILSLNKNTSIVEECDLNISVRNELVIITKILLYIKSKNYIDYDRLLDSVIPNNKYDFLRDLETDDDYILNFDINDGFDLLKLYEKLQNQKDKKIFGQFYTPHVILEKMLSDINIETYSVGNYKILDPACGVGAFLLKLIDKCVNELKEYKKIKEFLNNCIFGNDINTNSVLMTRLCIIMQLKKYFSNEDILRDFKNLFKNIRNVNTLFYNDDQKFELIIGNPPYFKSKISKEINEKYGEVIDGQPNVYALFLYWAVSTVTNGGQVIFVVPQSMMNGRYFKKLRVFLSNYDLVAIDLINSKTRNKIFLDAEQAVMIMNIKKSVNKTNSMVRYTNFNESDTQIIVEDQSQIFSAEFITFPKNDDERKLIDRLSKCLRLYEIIEPYKFGNGLFVWNQQKQFLIQGEDQGIPIIYANYISNQMFNFIPGKNNMPGKSTRKAFCIDNEKNKNFQYNVPTLIVKRTSSLNNFQRIRCSLIPEAFIDKYKSYFLENHVNMLYNCANKLNPVDNDVKQYIYYYLKSNVANYFIKKTNGNTQVSAAELNSLPFFSRRLPVEDLSIINWQNDEELQDYFYVKFKLTKKEILIIEGEKNGN